MTAVHCAGCTVITISSVFMSKTGTSIIHPRKMTGSALCVYATISFGNAPHAISGSCPPFESILNRTAISCTPWRSSS